MGTRTKQLDTDVTFKRRQVSVKARTALLLVDFVTNEIDRMSDDVSEIDAAEVLKLLSIAKFNIEQALQVLKKGWGVRA